MISARGLVTARVLGAACLVAACGGGAPLLHPAHVLGESRVSAGAGLSGEFVFGGGATAIEQGRVAGAGGSNDPEREFLGGAVSRAALAPGVAPWVGARVGLGGHHEGGLTYTGRTARVDARHAFGDESVAVSVGLGASAVLMHLPNREPASPQNLTTAGRFTGTSNDLTATGWGLDVPVVVGIRSTASIVEAWVGARAGIERITGHLDLTTTAATAGPSASVSAFRSWGGGLVGAAIGLRPFSVALELDVAYQSVSGKAAFPEGAGQPAEARATLTALTLAPAGAIIGKF